MSRVAVAAGTRVHADAFAIVIGKSRQREVVEIDEAMEKLAAAVDYHGQPRFGEVDLHLMCTFCKAAADFGFVLAQQVVDERLPRIVRNAIRGIHQTERLWRD